MNKIALARYQNTVQVFPIIIGIGLYFSFSFFGQAQQWLGFHGLERQGVNEMSTAPATWNNASNVVWKAKIPGQGYSSPVAIGDRIYLTTAYESNRGAALRTMAKGSSLILTIFAVLIAFFWGYRCIVRSMPGASKLTALISATLGAGIVIVIFGIAWFGEAHLGVSETVHRSWKVGALVAYLAMVAGTLMAGAHSKMRWLFAVAAIGACYFTWFYMPRRDIFMLLKTADGIKSTMVVLGFFVLAVAILIIWPKIRSMARIAGAKSEVITWLPCSAAIVVLLSGSACFVRFACLPGLKETAYAVVAIEKQTGRIDWLREVAYETRNRDLKVNSRATPTMVVSADALCVYFGSIGLFGLNPDGKVTWKVDDLKYESQFGIGLSPTMSDGTVIVVVDNEKQAETGAGHKSQIGAYDMKTGELRWRKERKHYSVGKAGFSTPIIRAINGKKAVLVRGWDNIIAYDLESGNEIWSYAIKYRGHHLVASLVSDERRLYAVDAKEIMALELEKLKDQRDAIVWSVPFSDEKAATPVVAQGRLYAVSEAGQAVCLDSETGKLFWKQRLRGKYFASPVAIGDKILFTNDDGDIYVVKQSNQYELKSRNPMGASVYGTPAPISNAIIIRTTEGLYCIGNTDRRTSK